MLEALFGAVALYVVFLLLALRRRKASTGNHNSMVPVDGSWSGFAPSITDGGAGRSGSGGWDVACSGSGGDGGSCS